MLILLSFDGVHYGDLDLVNLPNLDRLRKNGTFTQRLQTVFPSVTWNVHTSVVTGQYPEAHRIYGNRAYDRKKKKIIDYFDVNVSKEKFIAVPTFYDKLKEQGLKIASVCWPLTQGADSIDKNIPEFYSQEAFDSGCSPEFYENLREEGFPVSQYGKWSDDWLLGPMQDDLTTKIIEKLILEKETDVILGHFLLHDSYQHEFGVRSEEAMWALEYLDRCLGRILSDLEESDQYSDTNILVFSDHGHCSVDKPYDVNEIIAQKQKMPPFVIANNGGCVHVYANENHTKDDLIAAKKILADYEGTDAVYDESNYEKVHWSMPAGEDEMFPDMTVALKAGWCCTENNQCEAKSMHGYDPNVYERMNGFMVVSGVGTEKGQVIKEGKITQIYQTVLDLYKRN